MTNQAKPEDSKVHSKDKQIENILNDPDQS